MRADKTPTKVLPAVGKVCHMGLRESRTQEEAEAEAAAEAAEEEEGRHDIE